MTHLQDLPVENSQTEVSLLTKITNLIDSVGYSYDETKIPLFCNALQDVAVFSYLAQRHSSFKTANDGLSQQLCSVIFNFKTRPYEAFLSSKAGEPNLRLPDCNLLKFFKSLQDLAQENVLEDVSGSVACGTLMKMMMSEVLNTNRLDLEPLKILTLLCAVSGLDVPLLKDSDTCCKHLFKTYPTHLEMTALCQLLEACSLHPQYFIVATSTKDHLKPTEWVESLCLALLNLKDIEDKATWLKCFSLLLKISMPVIENNIVLTIKMCLLNIKVDSLECKEEYCNFFYNLISLHSRLHQLPKFFVKLLLSVAECVQERSGGDCILNGRIYPSVLKSMATNFEELHFGQIMELWKIFSETYTTFGTMSEIFTNGRGAVFLLAQLFSTFLMHSKLFDPSTPSDTYTKYGDLIQRTTKELEANVSVLLQNTNEVQVLQKAFLTLCLTLGEVKLIYNFHDEQTLPDKSSLKTYDNPFDCSLLFSLFNEEHTSLFEVLLNGDNKVLSFHVLELLILKIKSLMHIKELSDEEKNHLKLSISCVIQHAEQNSLNGAFWNLDLSSLSAENYGTAVWGSLLKLLPLILNSMESKELLKVCGCFREIMLQEPFSSADLDGTDLKTLILSSLKNTYFQESKSFQTALVVTVWKLDTQLFRKKRLSDESETETNLINVLMQLGSFPSKWMKYVESTPKVSEGETMNSLWLSLKDICELMNRILQSDSIVRPKLKSKVFNILQLLDCCSLEYLLPCNQVRCMIGLSVLLFSVPESCKADEALRISEQISGLLVAIFEGVRSIWFFDFVTSGSYLRELVNTMEKIQSENIPPTLSLLLNHVVGIISKNYVPLSAAEGYFSEIVKSGKYSEVSLLTLKMLLEKLAQIFHRVHLPANYKEVSQKIASSACSICTRVLKKYEVEGIDSTYSLLVRCYVEVIEILTSPACEMEQKKRDKYFSQIPKIIEIARENIQDCDENRDVIFKFFACICKHNQQISGYLPDGLYVILWNIVYSEFHRRYSNSGTLPKELNSADNGFKDNELDLLQNLLPLLTNTESVVIFQQFFTQMKNWDLAVVNPLVLEINLNFVKLIVDSDAKSQESSLSPSLRNLLPHLCFLVAQADDSPSHLTMLKIPVLEFINFLARQKKRYISDNQWLNCLHPCMMIKLESFSNNLPLFVKAFDALWNIVYNLLMYHPAVILKALAVFLILVTNLLKALVLAGAQDSVYKTDKETQNKLFLCSQNMNRLMTGMARHKIEFAKHVPFLIADYASSVQHVTLETNIKKHLILGFDRLLELCSDDSIKMIAVNINYSCREIFTNIVKNYKQSRYRGDV